MSGVICHGGGLDTAIAQFGGDKKDWLDLSTGINPNGYRVEEMEASIWQRLPDVGAMDDLLEAARNYYGVGENSSILQPVGRRR